MLCCRVGSMPWRYVSGWCSAYGLHRSEPAWRADREMATTCLPHAIPLRSLMGSMLRWLQTNEDLVKLQAITGASLDSWRPAELCAPRRVFAYGAATDGADAKVADGGMGMEGAPVPLVEVCALLASLHMVCPKEWLFPVGKMRKLRIE